MSDETTRKDILDLLARGKISVDEATELLGRSAVAAPAAPEPPDTPPSAEKPDVEEMLHQITDIKQAERIIIDEEDVVVKKPTAEVDMPRWLKVQVRNLNTGKNKVTVNIPLGMVKFGMRVASKFSPDLDEIDFDEMTEMISHGQRGTIVEVEDEDSNEQVLIYLD